MGVVLREGAHAGQSVQLAGLFVAIDGTELGDAQGQVTIAAGLPGEDFAVVRAVHGFQHVLFVLLGGVDGLEGVLAVVGIVSAGDVEVLRADVRGDDLLVAETLLHLAQVVLQAQAQVGTLGQPDGQSLAYLVGEHEELHLLANLAVVALLGFLEHDEVVVEHLLLGERDAVETLHLLAAGIATPEGTGNAGQLDGLDFARVHEVRATAQVGEVALCIGGDGAVFEVLLDVLTLIGLTVGSKRLQGIGLGDLAAHNGLLLRSQLFHLSLNRWEVALLDALAIGQQHVIEESVLDGGSETELDAGVQLLQRLCQQVCRGVPEGVLALLVLELVEGDGGIFHDGAVQLNGFSIHATAYHAACQSRRNALGNLKSGYALLIRASRSVRKSNLNHIYNICLSLNQLQRYE